MTTKKCQHTTWERLFTQTGGANQRPVGAYFITVCRLCDETKREVGIRHKQQGHKRFVKTTELQTNTHKFGILRQQFADEATNNQTERNKK